MYAECSQKVYNTGGNWAQLGGDTRETGGELAGIVWGKMGWMGAGVQGGRPQARRRSRRHGRSPCVSTQSKRPAAGGGGGFWLLGKGQRRGRAREGAGAGAGAKGRAGRRPGGGAADAGEARVFRRSRNGLRPVGVPQSLALHGEKISKTPKRPRSDVP